MKKLYQYESDCFDAYNEAINRAEDGCTLKELVEEIGFNNITILNPLEEDIDSKDITNIYDDSDKYYEMDEKMKNCRFVLSSTEKDYDGFTCAYVELEDKNDWKYFEEKK